ncbi:hydrolase [Deferribacterales bacterium Es71-Z0220]|uniref:hydrolase n=1 Tax=Deferrivibrio essentukiensis TaxID=2880922 RepID=UPI001F601ACE|nr:hydrolase [Deferrivibrio essentukiensis]MCB4203608.1 hydrolase [Deferrivibrio essentukiensis]
MFTINVNNTAFLLIDVQEKLVKAMDEKVYGKKLKNMEILLKSAKILNMPVLFTEQYVKGLGRTVNELSHYLEGALYFEKITFSCCGEDTFMDKLNSLNVENVIVFGMETHVCVLQTVLDLLNYYNVFVVKDAVQSRSKENWLAGLDYMSDAGAIITTTEIVLFMLLKKAKTDEFKAISSMLK